MVCGDVLCGHACQAGGLSEYRLVRRTIMSWAEGKPSTQAWQQPAGISGIGPAANCWGSRTRSPSLPISAIANAHAGAYGQTRSSPLVIRAAVLSSWTCISGRAITPRHADGISRVEGKKCRETPFSLRPAHPLCKPARGDGHHLGHV